MAATSTPSCRSAPTSAWCVLPPRPSYGWASLFSPSKRRPTGTRSAGTGSPTRSRGWDVCWKSSDRVRRLLPVRDRAHDARGRPRIGGLAGLRLDHGGVVLRQRLYVIFRLHVHDLETLGLKLQQQCRQRDRCRLLKIVHQNYALAALVELGHHRRDHLVGIPELEVERIEIGREDADVSFGEIGGQFRRLAQPREAEKRRQRTAGGDRNGAEAVLDLLLGILPRFLRQIDMRPRVGADGVIPGDDLLEDLRMPAR